MKQFLAVLFIIIGCSKSYAQKNVTVSQSFGNIKVVFTTGYYYEEINNALIIGQYAEKLSQKLNFHSPIILFFRHNIGHDREIFYHINNNISDNRKDREIYFEMKDREFNILNILKLMEYTILNKTPNIDGAHLFEEIKISTILAAVLENKIYRPAILKELQIANNGISYFFRNGRFHVFRKENDKEKILFDFQQIYQIAEIDEYSMLIFDSKESFYYVSSNKLKNPSPRIYIENATDQILPYKVCNLSNTLVSITFSEFRSIQDERVMLFNHRNEFLIQDVSILR